jgi:hypothetical protein
MRSETEMPAFQPVSPLIALAESREKEAQYLRVSKESMNMFKLQCARVRLAAGPVLAVFLAATLHAQTSTAGQSGSAAIDALLAKAGTMYYSAAKAGLTGFDCAVHPDWHTLLTSADPGTAVSDNDSRVMLLNGVAITLHARLKGGSTLDWTPAAGSATDADSTSVLTQGHQNTDLTLLGFLGMWTKFVDGSLVPANSSGFDVTQGPSTFTLHQGSNGFEMTEVFSNDLLVEEFDLIAGGISMKTEPTFKATAQGLLVEGFVAQIQQMGNPPGPVQEMRAGVEYQTIAGFPIPRQLSYKEGGTTMFNMSLDGCTTVRQ